MKTEQKKTKHMKPVLVTFLLLVGIVLSSYALINFGVNRTAKELLASGEKAHTFGIWSLTMAEVLGEVDISDDYGRGEKKIAVEYYYEWDGTSYKTFISPKTPYTAGDRVPVICSIGMTGCYIPAFSRKKMFLCAIVGVISLISGVLLLKKKV